MKLFDLMKFTYREGELYKYDSNILLLNKHEEFQSKFYHDEEEDSIEIMALPYDDEKYNVDCQGICECYVENEDRNRRSSAGTLIYSSRFSKTVVVSIIGLALARFVSETIDDCYEAASEFSDERDRLTCSFSFLERLLPKKNNGDTVDEEDDETKRKDLNPYSCTGRCHIAKHGKNRPKIEWDMVDEYICHTSEPVGTVWARKASLALRKFELQQLPQLCAKISGLTSGVKCAPMNGKICIHHEYGVTNLLDPKEIAEE